MAENREMNYISHYESPLGTMLLSADEAGLTGAWFIGQKHFAYRLEGKREEKEIPVLAEAKRWLDIYFSGKEPNFSLPIHLKGSPFQEEVWGILKTIPYGSTMTYGEIGKILAARKGLDHMSAQAVGGAVGRNPIFIIVPCHRVIGKDGSLTGYAGGIEKKRELLLLEGALKR